MRKMQILLSALAVLGALTAPAAPGLARLTGEVVSSGLAADLAAGGDAPRTIWVRFRDKGLDPAARDAAVVRFAADLEPAARQRRERRRTIGGIADTADLPLAAAYLEQVAATGARPRQQSRWLNAASYDATPAQIAAIAGLPCVVSLDLVARAAGGRLPLTETPPGGAADRPAAKTLADVTYGASLPGLQMHNIRALHDRGLTGRGVTVAILDTGFQLDHESLRDLDIVATWDFINGGEDVGQRREESDAQDLYGTASLSVLAGYSPDNLIGAAHGAAVILAKTEDLSSETPAEEDNWIAALEWAESLGADVVSSGLGYYEWYTFSQMDGVTAAITVAAEMAAARGVCVVSGTGDLRTSADWPHLLPPSDGRSVIGVGTVDANRQVNWFSSPGPTADGRIKPDVAAFGAGHPVAVDFRNDIYNAGYGSNYAVPLVAGAVALMLEQDPSLSPLEILAALRATGSAADAPNNDVGWGAFDAAAALDYHAPAISHSPLGDSEGGTGPHAVSAVITDRRGLDTDRLYVAWRAGGGAWSLAPLTAVGPDSYTGLIPPQNRNGLLVEYHLIATNAAGVTSTLPAGAPQQNFGFREEWDTTAPVLSHLRLPDMTLAAWPPRVEVTASDNQGLAGVELIVSVPGQGTIGPVPLVDEGEVWAVDLPVDVGSVFPGFELNYFLVARDQATTPNATTIGPFSFRIVATKGRVLLVDDRWVTKSAAGPSRRDLSPVTTAPTKSAADIAAWLVDAGFTVETMMAADVQSSSFFGYDAVMVTSGSNFGPLVPADLRRAMTAWTARGGRLVLEGGETAYAIGSSPGYPELLGDVIPISGYAGEDAGVLRPSTATEHHPILVRPHRLAVPFEIDNAGGNDWGATDLALAAPGDVTVMKSLIGNGFGGVFAHDADTGPEAGQVVYLSFDLAKAAPLAARRLLDNVLTYLVGREAPGPTSVTGTVTLAGAVGHDGVLIRIGRDHETVTAADGSFRIDGLWGGEYVVTVTADGYAPGLRRLTLTEGEEASGTDFYLVPVIEAAYTDAPATPIPDNDPTGIEASIDVVDQGLVHGMTVDIGLSHFAVGQLQVKLTAPDGTVVTLHNRTGGTADDLVGTWPTSLLVDGPGDLSDFIGRPAAGRWTLSVSDHQLGAVGTLDSWGLRVLVQATGASDVGAGPSPVTRLAGNTPNPFNPRTTIAFELARPGAVRLGVYDVRGRLVRILLDDSLQAGPHAVLWDGRNESGGEAASGLYFARLQADGRQETRKMTLVR